MLLLDEPLGALDLKLRRQLQVELKRIQTEVGITFVYVTHDQEEALTMSDRIAVMNAGRVEQLGTPEELYERPATRFVADFIGTTNLLTGSVESAEAGTAVIRLDGGDACRIEADRSRRPVIRVELCIRPESVVLRPSNGSDRGGPEPLRAQVEQAAYLGGSVQYQVRTRGGLSITALAPKTGFRLPVGSAVDVGWPSSEALVLGPTAKPGGGQAMNDRHDGSSIDLEKALVRYMVERRITRRELLERIAMVGGAAALAPIIAACTTSGNASAAAASVRGVRLRRTRRLGLGSSDAGPLARRRALHPTTGPTTSPTRSSSPSRRSTASR